MTTAISSADALADRLLGAALGALELFSVCFGAELNNVSVREVAGAPRAHARSSRTPERSA